jgi:hypothetical protein
MREGGGVEKEGLNTAVPTFFEKYFTDGSDKRWGDYPIEGRQVQGLTMRP